MASTDKMSARAVALLVLGKFDPKTADAADVLYRYLPRTDQRGQATDIVFGVIRNRKLIDHLIAQMGNLQLGRVQKRVLNILRIGIYELVFAPDTADYAIVNEAVELARTRGGRKVAGFANAVLRNVTRAIDNRKTAPDSTDKRLFVPNTAEWGCSFKHPVLPDPAENAAKYLALAYSLPEWLVGKWIDQLGPEKAKQACTGSNRRPGVWIRPNRLTTTLRNLCERFEQADIAFEISLQNDMLRLTGGTAVPDLPGYTEGLFSVQDPTAAKVARLMQLEPEQTVLDLCAAPGGKTTHIAEVMNDRGTVIASDIDEDRLKTVAENCQRLSITSVKTALINNVKELTAKLGQADRVLLDVPCSNTGVMARRAEVRIRINQSALTSLAQVQSGILNEAAELVKPGGTICYSTCSIMDEENQAIVRRFTKINPNFRIEIEELTLPGVGVCGNDLSGDHDGGYACLLRNISTDIGDLQ